ncbi:MAG: AzlD domain-containing protein [Burkholderiaceae bacterium]
MSADWRAIALVGAIALISVLTRSLFFISRRSWTLPPAAQTGLKFAPVAALAAVIAPEVVMSQGHLIGTWMDARLYALAAGMAWFYFRGGVLGTIVAGMAVYLPLHIGLGW